MDKLLLFAETHPVWVTVWLFVLSGLPKAVAGTLGRKETVIIREKQP